MSRTPAVSPRPWFPFPRPSRPRRRRPPTLWLIGFFAFNLWMVLNVRQAAERSPFTPSPDPGVAAAAPAAVSGDAVDRGRELFASMGCEACHGLAGEAKIGPPLNGVAGDVRTFEDGSSGIADDGYLRRSIVDPQAQVVAGYPGSMPSFEPLLAPEDLDALVAFLRSID